MNVDDYIRTPGYGPEKLHHLLQVSHDQGALISCTLGGHHTQEAINQRLQNRHAYTVTGVTQVYIKWLLNIQEKKYFVGEGRKKQAPSDSIDTLERSTWQGDRG